MRFIFVPEISIKKIQKLPRPLPWTCELGPIVAPNFNGIFFVKYFINYKITNPNNSSPRF